MTDPDLRGVPVPDRGEDTTTPLAKLIKDGRPPWAWSNLTDDEADELHTSLLWFVATCNGEYAVELDHVIPACWPQHARLRHELPALYWAWWASHRDPTGSATGAEGFYRDVLPAFQGRLSRLLGAGATACRKGDHFDLPPDVVAAICTATDNTACGRTRPGDWRRATFGV
jgi:hypothetical protein